MRHEKRIILPDGSDCLLRSADESVAQAVLELFIRVRGQTENLLTYPDEVTLSVQDEENYLRDRADSSDAVELCAFVGGKLTATAGISPVGQFSKLRHRAQFGINVDREYWRRGIGRALTLECIECAKAAGYTQLELDVVSDNTGAVALYRQLGFTEYGRNPKGLRTRSGQWQELILMRLELNS